MVRRPPESASLFSPRLLSFVRDRFETYRIARDTTRWYRDMYGPANADGWQRTKDDLRAMQKASRLRGVPMMVALWPLLVDLERDYPFADVHDKIGRVCERVRHPLRRPAARAARPDDLVALGAPGRLAPQRSSPTAWSAEALAPRVHALPRALTPPAQVSFTPSRPVGTRAPQGETMRPHPRSPPSPPPCPCRSPPRRSRP